MPCTWQGDKAAGMYPAVRCWKFDPTLRFIKPARMARSPDRNIGSCRNGTATMVRGFTKFNLTALGALAYSLTN